MNKRDRVGARTPAALDRQYNIGGNLLSLNKTISKQAKQAEQYTKELEELLKSIVTEERVQEMINASMADMKEMIDTAVDTALVDKMLSGTITMLVNQTATKVGQYAFYNHPSLQGIDLSAVTTIEANAFKGASKLQIVILRSNTMVTLEDESAFDGTPIAIGSGCIYVPGEIYDLYANDLVWSNYTLQAIENYSA